MLCLVSALVALTVTDGFAARCGSFGPKVEVLYSRPTLRWEVWSDQGAVMSVRMTLNGQEVAAGYDPQQKSVTYTPIEPLAPGDIAVHCDVTFAGPFTFAQDWTTRISSAASSILPSLGESEGKALIRLNQFRDRTHLAPLAIDARMSAAAKAHCSYLSCNHEFSHTESPSGQKFIGVDPPARLEAFGWAGSVWEDIEIGPDQTSEAITDLIAAPYHRISLLQPGQTSFGFGKEGRVFAIEVQACHELGLVCSPGKDEVDVPCSWVCHETPSPLSQQSDYTEESETGYPIVVAQFGCGGHLSACHAVLQTEAGAPAEVWTDTPESDENLSNAVIVIPKHPLKKGTRYVLKLEGVGADGKPLSLLSSFKTALQ